MAGRDIVGGGTGAPPVVKSKPHASQNWPTRGAPHRGQSPASAGAAAFPKSAPASAGSITMLGAPIRKPHTSQKSSLADSWPDGQVAIATPS